MTSDDDRLQLGLKYTEAHLQREMKSQEQRLRSEFEIEIAKLRTNIAESQYETTRWVFMIANIFLLLIFALFIKVFL